jgi:hypothetical protein
MDIEPPFILLSNSSILWEWALGFALRLTGHRTSASYIHVVVVINSLLYVCRGLMPFSLYLIFGLQTLLVALLHPTELMRR